MEFMDIVILLAIGLSSLGTFFAIKGINQSIMAQQARERQLLEDSLRRELGSLVAQNRQETLLLTQEYIKTMAQSLLTALNSNNLQMEERNQALERAVTTQLVQLNNRIEALLSQNQQQSEGIRKTLEERLGLLSEENSRSLHQMRQTLETLRQQSAQGNEQIRGTLQERFDTLLGQNQQQLETNRKTLEERLGALGEENSRGLHQMRQTLETLREQSIQSNQQMRTTVQERLEIMQRDNNQRLDEMRQTVDEKLQKTLNDRLAQSFELVNRQLEQVHKGLGEMQNLAVGVGDLKKVLSNVKTRGTLGEIQLGAILEQMLSSEQYKQNVVTRPSTRNPVEFAVVLPGDGDQCVLLPIDSKFPLEPYHRLLDAYDTGSADAVSAAYKQLEQAIKLQAKTIREKYVEPPYTTDFAIMFLPIEGLYAEVVRHDLIETLQRDYKINIAGPTTMAALLNSLQMGFRTLAIQKRSSEVWSTLSSVKVEFGKFGEVLEAAQSKLRRANDDLDRLIGTRTKAIIRRLRDVEVLEGEEKMTEIPALIDSEE